MKVADLQKQNKPPNILIGGAAGSGKTCLVAQANGGYLIRIKRPDAGLSGEAAAHPSEMEQDANEILYGYVTHYAIGVGLAVPYVLGWDLLVGGPASPVWALAYGVATTVAAYFFVFPSMGLGVFGRRSPEGIRAPLSSLANHLFYGVGLSVGVALV